MNTRHLLFLFFCWIGLLAHTSRIYAQASQTTDDCNLGEAASLEKARLQMLSDSMDQALFVPAPLKQTLSCATPATVALNVVFTLQPDKIYGFFAGVENANKYLVVLSDGTSQQTTPINGVIYKPGSLLGEGKIVAYNAATAFVASDLQASTPYNITIYAANENCVNGVQYNAIPVFSDAKKTTGTPVLNRYYGNLHSHSSYSDGNQDNTNLTPADDYAYAKDALCMDFLGISEHNHYSYPRNPGMHVADYQLGIQQAKTFTDNNTDFLAMYGMEFGVIDNGGHVVIYGIDSLFGWETLVGSPNYDIFIGKYDYTGVNGLFNTVNRFVSNNAFAYCAHPNDSDYGNILGIDYQAFIDSALIGSALENGPAFSDATNYHDYPSTMSYLSYFKGLLAKGYHIGPTMDHDNHNYTFGRTARSRLVVMSPSLSKDDFMASMRSLNFYATHSCTAALDFQVFGTMMGKEMEHANAPAMVVTITDPSVSQQPTIRIYKGTNDGNQASIIATGYTSGFAYTDDNLADGQSAYYFVDISMGSYRTISAPVWYHRNDNPATAVSNNLPDVQQNQLLLLENPVRTSVLQYRLANRLHSSADVVSIVDLYGKVILNKTISNINSNNVTAVNLGNLPAGVYILNVLSDNKVYRKKFVKY